MPKLLTVICICMCFSANSQTEVNNINDLPFDSTTQQVTYTRILNFDSTHTADKIFSAAKEWFTTNIKNFNRSNSDKNYSTGDALLGTARSSSTSIDQLHINAHPLQDEDKDAKTLIGKSVIKYSGTSMGCIRIVYWEYDIKIYIKDYKLKVQVTDFNYTHYNQMSMKEMPMGTGESGACKSKNTIEGLKDCKACKNQFADLYKFLDAQVNDQIESLNKAVAKPVSNDNF